MSRRNSNANYPESERKMKLSKPSDGSLLKNREAAGETSTIK